VCASAGNFGQAMAYVGRSQRIPVQVFVANDVNPAKAERMRSLGAKVTLCDGDFDVAKQNARRQAVDHPDCTFVEDGAEDAITEALARSVSNCLPRAPSTQLSYLSETVP
jgi:threonine dehydratase